MNGFSMKDLVLRIARIAAGPATFIALLAAVASFASAIVPPLVTSTLSSAITYDLRSSTRVSDREISATSLGGPQVGPSSGRSPHGLSAAVDEVWGTQADQLESLRDSLPAALRSSVDGPFLATSFDPTSLTTLPGTEARELTDLILGFDPHLSTRVRIVDGEMPPATTTLINGAVVTLPIVLSAAGAKAAEWKVGESRGYGSITATLSGTFEAVDPNDPYWSHVVAGLTPTTIPHGPERVVAVQAFADPASWQPVIAGGLAVRTNVWFSANPSGNFSLIAADVAQQARAFVSHPQSLTSDESAFLGDVASRFEFSTRMPDLIDKSVARNSVTLQSFITVLSGPLGVLIALLVLAARLFAGRLEPTMRLVVARGATSRQARVMSMTAVLVVALPAAIVAAIAATIVGALMTGAALSIATVALPIVVSILIAAFAAGLVGMTVAPFTGAGGSRARIIAEAALVALAAASILLVAGRPEAVPTARGASSAPPIDLLLAAQPTLLALVGAVVVLRLYPILLVKAQRLSKRSRGVVSFLGVAGAARRPPGGAVTALAVIVGLSIAVFSGALLSTLQRGIDDASIERVGSDLTVESTQILADDIETMRAVPGIDSVASIFTKTTVRVSVGASRENVSLIIVDSAELREAQKRNPRAFALPAALETANPDNVPVVISEKAAALFGDDDLAIADHPLDVVGVASNDTSLSPTSTWILVDVANQYPLVGAYFAPDRVFTSLDPSVPEPGIEAALRDFLPLDATILTPGQTADVQKSSPTIALLVVTVSLAILVSGIACALAVVMTLALGAARRARLVRLLAALGLSRRQATSLMIWEVAPVAVVAAVTGIVVGVVISIVVIGGTDLRPFTNGLTLPVVAIDPALTAIIVAAFVSVVAVFVALSSLFVRSRGRAGAVRSMEEG